MSAEAGPRWVGLRTAAVMAWFAAMFFVAGPWLVLRAEGSDVGEGLARSSLGPRLLAIAVLGMLGWQVADFVKRGRGTPAPFDPPRSFVVEGIYAHSRNPMYLLYTLFLAAEAWLFQSGWLLVYTAGFFGLAHLYVTRIEEPGLRRRFGAPYEAYCESVPRWLRGPAAR